MREEIKFLKDAVMPGAPDGSIMGCYVFHNGQIYARNQMLCAGAPAPLGMDDFNIEADVLNKTLGRMASEPDCVFEDDMLKVRSGRLKARISATRDAPFSISDQPKDGWFPAPAGFADALKAAAPFIGDLGWTKGIRVAKDTVTAISAPNGIKIKVPGLNLTRALLLDPEAADFLADRAPLGELTSTDSALWARWPDGKWAQLQVLSAEMPDRVDSLFQEPPKTPAVPITEEWREAFDDAAALSDGQVELRAKGFASGKGAGQVDVEFNTGLPEDHRSKWTTKALGNALNAANVWHPGDYPSPCPFGGENLRGIVLGVR